MVKGSDEGHGYAVNSIDNKYPVYPARLNVEPHRFNGLPPQSSSTFWSAANANAALLISAVYPQNGGVQDSKSVSPSANTPLASGIAYNRPPTSPHGRNRFRRTRSSEGRRGDDSGHSSTRCRSSDTSHVQKEGTSSASNQVNLLPSTQSTQSTTGATAAVGDREQASNKTASRRDSAVPGGNDIARRLSSPQRTAWANFIQKAINAKKNARRQLHISQFTPEVLKVVFRGLHLYSDYCDQHLSPLPHFVSFLNFCASLFPQEASSETCEGIVNQFCTALQSTAQQQNSTGMIHFFNGLMGITGFMMRPKRISGDEDSQLVDSWSFTGFLGLGNPSGQPTVDADSTIALDALQRRYTARERVLICCMPKIISACCEAIFNITPSLNRELCGRADLLTRNRGADAVELRRDSSAVSAPACAPVKKTEIDSRRDYAAVSSRATELLSELFLKYPYEFLEACLVVWGESIALPTGFRSRSLPLLLLLNSLPNAAPARILNFMGHILEQNFATKTPALVTGINCRESVIFDFMHSVVAQSPDASPILWQQLFRILNFSLTSLKQPLSFVWLFSIFVLVDSKGAIKDSSLTKKPRSDLQALFSTVMKIAARSFSSPPYASSKGLSPNAFDLHLPVPPASEISSSASFVGGEALSCLLELPDRLQARETFFSRVAVQRSGGHTWVVSPKVDSAKTQRDKLQSVDSKVETVLNTDPTEVAAHHTIFALILACSELGTANRRTAVTTLFLEVLCEALPTSLLPALHTHTVQTLQYRYFLMLLVKEMPYRLFSGCLPAVKKVVLEVLNSPTFFEMLDRRTLRCWVEALRRCMVDDLQRLDFVIPPPSTGIFTRRETDIVNRCRYLKRLTFVVHSCPLNTFNGQLPTILEKLVECLRMTGADMLHAQVMLCMRALLLKISPESLTSVWPLLLTELINVFIAATGNSAEEKVPPSLALSLAALKVVDLSSLLDLPAFHLYQWIFINDSIRSANLPEGGEEDASVTNYFKPFATMLVQQASQGGSKKKPPDAKQSKEQDKVVRRGPLVRSRAVTTKEELASAAEALDSNFVSSTLKGQKVDMDLINQSIENDLLEMSDALVDWGTLMDPAILFQCLCQFYRQPAVSFVYL
eukprot:Lankesteria_metandrocarpae@DN7213_c0_g1_i1.p1